MAMVEGNATYPRVLANAHISAIADFPSESTPDEVEGVDYGLSHDGCMRRWFSNGSNPFNSG